MPNDAKLGLVIGVGLVIAVAVLFFRRDFVGGMPGGPRSPAGGVNPPAAPPPKTTRPRGPLATAVSRTHPPSAETAGLRRHTVVEGDTLYTLALHYYGDGERFVDLYDANREMVKRPDRLESGVVLVIPHLTEE